MFSVPTTAKIAPIKDILPFPAPSLSLLLSNLTDQPTSFWAHPSILCFPTQPSISPFATMSLNPGAPWELQTRSCLKRRGIQGLQHREVPEGDALPILAPTLTAWLSPTHSSHLTHTPLPHITPSHLGPYSESWVLVYAGADKDTCIAPCLSTHPNDKHQVSVSKALG